MLFFFFKQKTAYEMRISDWSSDVCSSDLSLFRQPAIRRPGLRSRRTASHASAVSDVAPTYVGVAASSSMVVSGSPFDTMAAMPRSPVTLTTVRDMSRKWLTPRIRPMPSGGTQNMAQKLGRAHVRTPVTNEQHV